MLVGDGTPVYVVIKVKYSIMRGWEGEIASNSLVYCIHGLYGPEGISYKLEI